MRVNIKEIESENIDLAMKKSDKIIIDFFTKWCPSCRMVAMNLEEFEENHPEVLIIQIDAGEYKTLTDLYKVKTAPTLLFFKNGNYLDRHQGFIEAEEIASVFENNE